MHHCPARAGQVGARPEMTTSFPGPALAMVERMQAAAASDPARAIAYQGSPGANSHRAASEAAPDYLPLAAEHHFQAGQPLEAARLHRLAAENLAFAQAQGFPFRLLSDIGHRVALAYGVARDPDDKFADFARRYSYLIDPEGTIHRAYDVTDVAHHAGDVIADVERAVRSR